MQRWKRRKRSSTKLKEEEEEEIAVTIERSSNSIIRRTPESLPFCRADMTMTMTHMRGTVSRTGLQQVKRIY